MHTLTLALFLAPALFVAAPVRQTGDDAARGAFIKGRPVARTTAIRTHRPRLPRHTPAPEPASTSAAGAAPVGIGISVYRVLDRARAVRANPNATFREGDDLRFVVEPGVDGYLYLFVITKAKDGTKVPVMIYPDARLDGADNFVYAHTVTEVPSRRNPSFDVFSITGGAATEEVFFVVSRDPLPGVPIGDELVRLCEGDPKACPWQPQASAWGPLEREAAAKAHVSVRADAKEVSWADDDAFRNRDLKLGSSDDEPSVVAVSASAGAPLLVRKMSIRHE